MSAPGYPMPANNLAAAAHDPTAVIGVRTAAWIVDALLYVLLIAFISATPLSPLAEYDDNPQGLDQEDACEILTDTQDATTCVKFGDKVYWTDGDDFAIQAAAWLAFVVAYIVLQGVTGWTPGKLLLGLRTVSEDGQKPGIVKSLIRSVLWIIDGLPCIPLVGFICALTTTGHRRLGDMAAKTFVVRKGDAGRPVVVPGMALTAVAPAPYGAPPGYPGAPPYQPPAPAPAPGAPGAWGAPPAPAAPQPPVWGTAPPASPPTAPPAPTPGPGDTARYDVPFGSGAAPVPAAPIPGPDDTGQTEIVPVLTPRPDDTAQTEIGSVAPAPVLDPEPSRPEPSEASSDETPVVTSDEPPAGSPADEPTPSDEAADESDDAAESDEAPAATESDDAPADEDPAGALTPPEGNELASVEAPAEVPAVDEPAAEPSEAEPATAEPATAAGASPAEAQEQGDSPYQPQWDAARGAYIQWDPNRSRWLQWDDTAKEWKPI